MGTRCGLRLFGGPAWATFLIGLISISPREASAYELKALQTFWTAKCCWRPASPKRRLRVNERHITIRWSCY
ncbi:hypothetical protein OsI_08897 [Oryza sativa Indica Group]|uniref:Uncharacterized protein n=2 Tax=Oryza sativa TaxID=4530 RepID=B9F2Y5_ORYSJ|nr:hypothetical protein OsI_08897 [Oryza sativa Indica Group]EEE57792.1 hypothetical protein OsJ_08343 [Oryza sativa Japonica Group]